MKIILKDIFLMDKGSSAYTEFDWSEDIIEFRENHPNPEAMDWIVGHIHSHNTMGVFFSGTDWSELNDNTPLHNFYLSVIVNNYLEMDAKLAMIGDPQFSGFLCKDEDGKDFKLTITDHKINPILFYYDCKVECNTPNITIQDAFARRLAEIQARADMREEKKRKETVIKSSTPSFPQLPPKNLEWANQNSYKGNPNMEQGELGDWGGQSYMSERDRNSYNRVNHLGSEDSHNDIVSISSGDDDEPEHIPSQEELFLCYVLRMGEEVEDDQLEEVLVDIEGANLNIKVICKTIIKNYEKLYDDYYKDNSSDDLPSSNIEDFIKVTEEIVRLMEEKEEQFDFLERLIEGIKEIGYKYAELKINTDE